jgi:hypothetical protein
VQKTILQLMGLKKCVLRYLIKMTKKANNPLGVLLPMMQPPQQLREMAAKAVMEEFGMLFAKLNSPDSGRILESSLQLLPNEVCQTMAYLIGNEANDISRGMIYELACRLAQKLGYNFESIEPITNAAGNIFILIHAEILRRRGHAEYLAPNDIFTTNPKYPGYNKLTPDGKEIYYQKILESITTPPKYVM